MHPQTVYAHWIATLEIFFGMSSVALATGLIFARFSRPHAKIMFARYAIIRPLDGRMTLMVRSANARQNVIAEAHARLRILRKETTAEGLVLRRLYDLTLCAISIRFQTRLEPDAHHRRKQPAVRRDRRVAQGQRYVAGADARRRRRIDLANHAGAPHVELRQIRWHYRFVDIMSEKDGVSHIDYAHFDEIVPLDAAPLTADVVNVAKTKGQ